jgi:mono/diheme cytochrome c family protein
MLQRFFSTLVAGAFFLLWTAAARAESSSDTEFFERKIRPLLIKHCQECHGEKKQEAGLRLDTRAGWEKGGDQGPAIVPHKPDASLLLKMVRGTPGKPPQMPPEKVLPADLVADLVKWIELGAPDPRTAVMTAARQIDWDEARKHWAYQPLAPSEPPAVIDQRFSQPIDRYVAAARTKAKLAAVPREDKRALLRRVTFGLTGLPPTYEESQAFLADDSPAALAKVVDRLLDSSAYGEHQARTWLDVARFAEDQAQSKELIPNAWRYRDWVIQAFNDDLPYDQFVKLQLAADFHNNQADSYRHLPALGFLGLGTSYPRPNDLARLQAEEWDDRVDTLTRGFLGLTVSCARCHDHKYDPIPTQDYYSLAGVIAGTTKTSVLPVAPAETIAAYEKAKAFATEKRAAAEAVLQVERDRVALALTAEFRDQALAVWRFHAQKQSSPKLTHREFATAAKIDPVVFERLDAYLQRDRGPDYPLAAWKKLLPKEGGANEPPAEVQSLAETYRDLAIKNLQEPLNKRNQDLQKELFSEQGVYGLTEAVLLASGNDAWKAEYVQLADAAKAAVANIPPEPPLCHGVQDQPTDRIKDLKVYLRGDPAKPGEPAPRRFLRILAGNDAPLFSQGSGRLELAEAIVSDKNPLTPRVIVNRTWQHHFGRGLVATASNFGLLGTPPSHPELLDYLARRLIEQRWSLKQLHREIVLSETYQQSSAIIAENVAQDPENAWLWHVPRRRLKVEEFRDATLAASGVLDRTLGGASADLDAPGNVRRTVYGRVSRYQLSDLLRLFDFPDPNLTSDRRNETTLPQQMLFLMNSPFMVERAKQLAARLEELTSAEQRVQRAIEIVYARPATEMEITLGAKFLSAMDAENTAKSNKLSRLERFAQSLLLSNEFSYVD